MRQWDANGIPTLNLLARLGLLKEGKSILPLGSGSSTLTQAKED
jgi:hypothetical protein